MEDLGREAFEFTMGDGGGGGEDGGGEGGAEGGKPSLEWKGETRTEEEKRKSLDDQVGFTVGGLLNLGGWQ